MSQNATKTDRSELWRMLRPHEKMELVTRVHVHRDTMRRYFQNIAEMPLGIAQKVKEYFEEIDKSIDL